jgi:group I intron endonuclease
VKSGVYVIRNTVNGKVYVGSSWNVGGRCSQHRTDLRGGKHTSRHLQAAWNRYGESAFEFEVLQRCAESDVFVAEQAWIDRLQAADRQHGYNSAPVAGSTRGIEYDEAFREKARQARLGRTHTPEAKARIGQAHRGKVMTEEQRANMRAAQRLRNPDPPRRRKARPRLRRSNVEFLSSLC